MKLQPCPKCPPKTHTGNCPRSRFPWALCLCPPSKCPHCWGTGTIPEPDPEQARAS